MTAIPPVVAVTAPEVTVTVLEPAVFSVYAFVNVWTPASPPVKV